MARSDKRGQSKEFINQDNLQSDEYTLRMNFTSAYSLTQQDWKTVLSSRGVSPNVLPFWLDGLYKNRDLWSRHVSPKIVEELTSEMDFDLPEISHVSEAQDGTVKFLIRFKDQMEVETVLIPFHKRFTVCLSTQVGCGMNCSFCYTGTQGLKRNLTAGEIVGQYLVARNWSKHALNPSIVFMGQGEPLHNVSEVLQAIKVLNDRSIIGVGHRQMTLSTVGYLPGMSSLKDFPRINVALSLHSPFEDERSQLIPVNGKFPLKDVVAALDELPLLKRQFITFEYLLIRNFNMTDRHVEGLAELLGDRPAIMNLIPFNPFPGSNWERPTVEEIEAFKEKLVAKKIRVMVRTTKGSDILAACGQLKVNKLARKNGTH
jgi:23S rRNA (adenine2503-C2)-methyltransferase